jgi:hypothetical protein
MHPGSANLRSGGSPVSGAKWSARPQFFDLLAEMSGILTRVFATAQTRGIFRVPGAVRVVNALYDYYCYTDSGGDDITGTVRCANLPLHIKASVHDVASTFKKFLSTLPGGILGSLSVFDAFVAIHSQLRSDPELNKTKQTKVRARLIALAIGTLRSQFQRELVCAVFGLLSLVGRIAEVSPREDEQGRPLPTTDLMGYSALGIVFGPLLVGDSLNSYTMKLAAASTGLVLFPSTPPKLRKVKQKHIKQPEPAVGLLTVDKIHVANNITEMLITHWREVVRQMKNLEILRRTSRDSTGAAHDIGSLRPSTSESFIIRKPRFWDTQDTSARVSERSVSPTPDTPTPAFRRFA